MPDEYSPVYGSDAMHALLDDWFDVNLADSPALQEQNRRWFASTPAEDHALAERFGSLARAAAAGDLDLWSGSPQGRLALIILLDQCPRNLHRGQPEAFAQDDKALALCLGGIELHMHEQLNPLERVFFCMPLQHSESLVMQELSVATFTMLADGEAPEALAEMLANVQSFAEKHRDIIARFGRFPHRNRTLGRATTTEEAAFLASGGPSFGQ